jgi:hypothetical protein
LVADAVGDRATELGAAGDAVEATAVRPCDGGAGVSSQGLTAPGAEVAEVVEG